MYLGLPLPYWCATQVRQYIIYMATKKANWNISRGFAGGVQTKKNSSGREEEYG